MTRRSLGAIVRPLGNASPALLIALFPKCLLCFGAYLAILSSVGLDKLRPGVLQAITIAGLALSIVLLGRAAGRRGRWIAFGVACAGAGIVVGGRLLDAERGWQFAGAALLYAGALRIYLGRCGRRACLST
jgi:hypothetical protein